VRFAGAEGNEELRWYIADGTEKQAAFGPQVVKVD
jgi:hypothetical protein